MRANFTVRLFSRVSTIAASRAAPRRRVVPWARCIIAALAVTIVVLDCARLDAAQFYPLGPAAHVAVSGDGRTVAGWGHGGDSPGFRWTAADGFSPLPLSPNAINYDGSVMVGHCAGIGPCKWTVEGGIQGLPLLPFAMSAHAFGVSGDGSVVVGDMVWRDEREGIDSFATIWFANGEDIEVLQITFLADAEDAYSTAASYDGRVVVGAAGPGAGAFRWTLEDGLTDLGALPGGNHSSALAISADGSVIVGGATSPEGGQAFRWTAETGMVAIGPGSAEAVSGDGALIGGVVGDFDEGFTGWLWDAHNGSRNVKHVFESDYDIDLTGWTLTGVLGISNDGRTIVGFGRNPAGEVEVWAAVIPEPSSIALLVAAATALPMWFLNRRRTFAPRRPVARRQRQRRFGYEPLESRQLLAINLGTSGFDCQTGSK